ncbi:MAG: type II and III secretion system protein [Puniceicoccales bacterium]|nr:type II and III secretion system protein [Puniceicoccales bacterium]
MGGFTFALEDFLWGDVALAQKIYSTQIVEGEASTADMDVGSSAREVIRQKLFKETDQAWGVEMREIVRPKESPPLEDELSSLGIKLSSIVIPKIAFNNVPVRHVLDTLVDLAEKLDVDESGINIILLDEPSETACITLALRQISLGKIIEHVAQIIGYEFDIEDDAVILSSAEKNRTRLRTQFFPVSRAAVAHLTNLRTRMDSKDLGNQEQIKREEELLRSFLQNAGIDFISACGATLAFDGSQLIVTQTPRNLRRIRQILSHYAKIKQVEIETKFIEVQNGLLEELQFQLSLENQHVSVQTGDSTRTLAQAFAPAAGASGGGKITDGKDGISIPNQAPILPNLANLSQAMVPLGEVFGIIKGAQIHSVIRALEQHTGSDLMSAPKVTVLSGKTAEIVVAQEMRYPEAYDEIQSSVGMGSSLGATTSAGVTITAGTPRNFKTRNIGVEMVVTPFVEDDDKITLQLEPTVTEFERFVEYGGASVAVAGNTTVTIPSGFYQPVFTTRKIRTELTIENGATVVMGGLTREEVKQTRDKVPLLGDIPVVGKLFRSRGNISQKRNLLIFVTARLVDPQGAGGVDGEVIFPPPGKNHQRRH